MWFMQTNRDGDAGQRLPLGRKIDGADDENLLWKGIQFLQLYLTDMLDR